VREFSQKLEKPRKETAIAPAYSKLAGKKNARPGAVKAGGGQAEKSGSLVAGDRTRTCDRPDRMLFGLQEANGRCREEGNEMQVQTKRRRMRPWLYSSAAAVAVPA